MSVSRIKATSSSSDLSLILDLNSELYPLQKDEIISLNFSSSLRLDGKEDKGWRDLGRGEHSLADDYDYVCYGKVYRFDGGLLMNLEGSYRKLSKLAHDNVYLLIRK